MPVSFLPLIVSVLLFGIPLGLALSNKKRACLVASAISAAFIIGVLLSTYVPGWVLMAKAGAGDPSAQYRLAKWCENHCEKIGSIILWPCEPDVLAGYAWLDKAAQQDYPPALYALGVRLKYGMHVPRPTNWNGPAGNVFPQPERGQRYIEKAQELGYTPIVDEESFYWHVFRGLYVRDPNG